ncbi:unnamed protein product [Diabrotica balteata]|uniref:Metalloendopeptidase n=1 Tax=Diabrotica balteata TaxID=107213 RepID=A0A9N9XD09_DIABA|nr:unnamed protein product [Diabrotica balteata]
MSYVLLLIVITVSNVKSSELKKFTISNYTEKVHPAPLIEDRFTELKGNITNNFKLRNGVTSPFYQWEGGIIPYEIRGSFSNHELHILELAKSMYLKYTCIQLIPRTTQDVYLTFNNLGPLDCVSSSVGKSGTNNHIWLNHEGCFNGVALLVHELMHVVGFFHEHSRYDRDSYVTILWNNIQFNQRHNFQIQAGVTYGLPYDYDSLTHYAPYSYSGNNEWTIIPKDMNYLNRIGQRIGFSKLDITKINIMYNCPDKTNQLNLQDGYIYQL